MAHSKIIYTPLQTRALVLDGAHSLSLADAAFNIGSGSLGLDLLGQINSASPSDYVYLAGKAPDDLNGHAGWILFARKSTSSLELVMNDGGAAAVFFPANANAISFDSHLRLGVLIDRAASTATFRVNGTVNKVVSIAAVAGSLDNSDPLRLGGDTALIYTLDGRLDLVRFDKNRLLPDAWYAQEWDRLRFGCRREAQDFLACWLFGDTLVDSSPSAFPLAWQGGGAPAYADGWPYNAGPLSYVFEKDCETDYEFPYLDRDDKQVAADGSDFTDAAPLKRTFKLSFKALPLAQQAAILAAWQTRQAFRFYLDGDYPADGWYKFNPPPPFKHWFMGAADADLTLEES